MNAGEQWWENHRAESLTTQLTRLEGLVELLQTEAQLPRRLRDLTARVCTVLGTPISRSTVWRMLDTDAIKP